MAGGSGSGMVLPVLQQARRTFGPDPIIWVISVGEGASEDNQVAMVNTPFIISDILQANYDGIHVPFMPIDESQWRTFAKDMKIGSEEIQKSLVKFIDFSSEFTPESYDTDKTLLLDNLNTIFKGGHKGSFGNATRKMAVAYSKINEIKISTEFDNLEGQPPITLSDNFPEDAVTFMKEAYLDRMNKLNDILPLVVQAKAFTSWCKTQAIGGNRPAAHFWQQWLKCQFEPLSLFIKGREKELQTVADAGEAADEPTGAPPLTSVHLKSLIDRLYHDAGLKQSKQQTDSFSVSCTWYESIIGFY